MTTPHIFVLDDDPARLAKFRDLEPRVNVTWATNVTDAIRIFKERYAFGSKRPDALFLDHDLNDFTDDMVERTGLTFASWLAQNNDHGQLVPRDTPIVLHSWNPDGAQAMRTLLRIRGGFTPIVLPFGAAVVQVAASLANREQATGA